MSPPDMGTPLAGTPGGGAFPAPAVARIWRPRWRGKLGLRICVGLLILVVLISAAMRIFGFGHPFAQSLNETLVSPSFAHPFGTDDLGRDVFVRTVYATLTDLQIGLIVTIVPAIVGIAIGSVSGYLGGRTDAVLGRFADFILAFPLMVLLITVVAVIGPGLTGVYLALMVKGLPVYLRLARGEMLVVREQQFVLCARTLGLSHARVICSHAVIHVIRPIVVFAVFDLLGNVLLLASLSYLGLGIQPPGAEWGAIMAGGQSYLLEAWWISTLPGVFVVFIGLCLSVIGDGLAEILRLETSGGR